MRACGPKTLGVWSCWRGKTTNFILVAADTNSFRIMSCSFQSETVPHTVYQWQKIDKDLYCCQFFSFAQLRANIHKTCNKCCLICSAHKKTVKTLRSQNIPWIIKSFLYYFLPSFFFFFGLLSSSRITSSAIRTLLVFDSSSTGPVDRKKTRKLMLQTSGET